MKYLLLALLICLPAYSQDCSMIDYRRLTAIDEQVQRFDNLIKDIIPNTSIIVNYDSKRDGVITAGVLVEEKQQAIFIKAIKNIKLNLLQEKRRLLQCK